MDVFGDLPDLDLSEEVEVVTLSSLDVADVVGGACVVGELLSDVGELLSVVGGALFVVGGGLFVVGGGLFDVGGGLFEVGGGL